MQDNQSHIRRIEPSREHATTRCKHAHAKLWILITCKASGATIKASGATISKIVKREVLGRGERGGKIII